MLVILRESVTTYDGVVLPDSSEEPRDLISRTDFAEVFYECTETNFQFSTTEDAERGFNYSRR